MKLLLRKRKWLQKIPCTSQWLVSRLSTSPQETDQNVIVTWYQRWVAISWEEWCPLFIPCCWREKGEGQMPGINSCLLPKQGHRQIYKALFSHGESNLPSWLAQRGEGLGRILEFCLFKINICMYATARGYLIVIVERCACVPAC